MQIAFREFEIDAQRAALPHAESHVVVRFGPTVPGGLDVAAIGAREHVHRKWIRAGTRVVMARIPLGLTRSVLGVSAAEIAGRIVALEDLWGDAARVLRDRLAAARRSSEAAALVERAISDRMTSADRADLALAAADKLVHASVRDVAEQLGVSERQLRRVFRDAVGLSPKSFARLARFHRALEAARGGETWTRIAADAGYCDQAHLIDEFRSIAGTTPRAFMTELPGSMSWASAGSNP